jgi:hypothetical protein
MPVQVVSDMPPYAYIRVLRVVRRMGWRVKVQLIGAPPGPP